jgi:hypothetical protein
LLHFRCPPDCDIDNAIRNVHFTSSIEILNRSQRTCAIRVSLVKSLSIGIRVWYHNTPLRARRSVKFMPKRGSDADSRIFFDELVSVGVSRLKARGVIRLEARQAIIPFGETKQTHRRRAYGLLEPRLMVLFSLPVWSKGQKALAPRRCATLQTLPRKARSALPLGLRLRPDQTSERARSPCRQAAGHARRRPDAPQTCAASWGKRRLDRRNRLTWAVQRARIDGSTEPLYPRHSGQRHPATRTLRLAVDDPIFKAS